MPEADNLLADDVLMVLDHAAQWLDEGRRVALATMDIPTYPADALPPELAKIPPVKPGSRQSVGAT